MSFWASDPAPACSSAAEADTSPRSTALTREGSSSSSRSQAWMVWIDTPNVIDASASEWPIARKRLALRALTSGPSSKRCSFSLTITPMSAFCSPRLRHDGHEQRFLALGGKALVRLAGGLDPPAPRDDEHAAVGVLVDDDGLDDAVDHDVPDERLVRGEHRPLVVERVLGPVRGVESDDDEVVGIDPERVEPRAFDCLLSQRRLLRSCQPTSSASSATSLPMYVGSSS